VNGAPRRVRLAVVVCCVSLLSVSSAAGEPCPPRTELVGDREAIERVSSELARLGAQIGPATPGCPAVRANVELDREGGIAVAIVDGARRSEGRVVSDAGVAAAWIDSFLRDDVEGFQRDDADATTTTAITAPAATRPAPPAPTPVPAPGGSLFERFGASVGVEQSWPEGDATATGIAVASCLRVGRRLCLGTNVHYASEDDRAVNSTAMARNDLSVLATASLAFTLGHITVVPEVGVGFGRRSTRRLDCDPAPPPPNCDPNDPTCANPDGTIPPSPTDPGFCENATLSKYYVGDQLHAITYTPRVATGLRLAIPLFEHVWLEGVAAFELAPFGHARDFTTTAADGSSPGELALPGEPTDALHLGVGLRVGAP
jgi:hypothetical protein